MGRGGCDRLGSPAEVDLLYPSLRGATCRIKVLLLTALLPRHIVAVLQIYKLPFNVKLRPRSSENRQNGLGLAITLASGKHEGFVFTGRKLPACRRWATLLPTGGMARGNSLQPGPSQPLDTISQKMEAKDGGT